MKKKLKSKDKRLQRTYGITLEQHNRRSNSQGKKCWICRVRKNSKGKVKDLHVDHWHWLAKVKVKLEKLKNGYWKAYNVEATRYGYSIPEAKFKFKSRNKRKAKKQVTQCLKRAANRGLICWPCNAGIHRWDDPIKLRRALKYLDVYFKKLKEEDYDFSHA